MASNTVVNDVVTSKEKDTTANVALHKERYLHWIENKYRSGTINGSTAMFRAENVIRKLYRKKLTTSR